MLMRVPHERSDRAQIDRTAHRRLDPLLIEVDLRLQKWSTWAVGYYAERLPVRPIAGAKCPTSARSAWPAPVLATDESVRSLDWDHAGAVMAQYFNPAAERLAAYVQLLEHFTAARPAIAGRMRRPPGQVVFERKLSIARWILRALLQTPARY
jgi:hypothetical protein